MNWIAMTTSEGNFGYFDSDRKGPGCGCCGNCRGAGCGCCGNCQ